MDQQQNNLSFLAAYQDDSARPLNVLESTSWDRSEVTRAKGDNIGKQRVTLEKIRDSTEGERFVLTRMWNCDYFELFYTMCKLGFDSWILSPVLSFCLAVCCFESCFGHNHVYNPTQLNWDVEQTKWQSQTWLRHTDTWMDFFSPIKQVSDSALFSI